MPLNTSITRNGELLRLHWGNFHIAAMALAASFDDDTCTNSISDPAGIYLKDPRMFECYPDAPFPVTRNLAFTLTNYGALSKTPLNMGSYTLKRKHKFMDLEDGEVLELLPGDILTAIRSSR